jgi:predicted unusual protein kinase regulating ubiquinone biosynthesis (AarF/ABC1/UbiB family)
MEIANRTIYQFPFKLPRNLVLYMRMLSILEGVVLTLDEKFRFIQILGTLLEREGLIQEAYKEEIKDTLKRLGESLDATIELAPILKRFLEDQEMQRTNLQNNQKHRGFTNGTLAGIGASALFVSVFYLGNNYGKIGMAASIILLIVAVVRRR